MDIETVFETARLLVVDSAERIESPRPDRLDVYLKDKDELITVVTGLRVKRLGYLAAITGLDPGNEHDDLEILYHFCTGPAVITLRLLTSKNSGSVSTLTEIIPSAEPYERELSEMFGILVVGLRNPEHLYLPDEWLEGIYPLRKDFDPQILQV